MSTISLSPGVSGATNTFVSIPVTPTPTTEYTTFSTNTIEAKRPVVSTEPQIRFLDSTDQIAWEAFMRIEPRYSDANRRLAQ